MQTHVKNQEAVDRLVFGDHHDPHTLLGLHEGPKGAKVIRLWRPEAIKVHLEVFGKIVEAKRVHEAGIFEYPVPPKRQPMTSRLPQQRTLSP